jgi:hypothetical protein
MVALAALARHTPRRHRNGGNRMRTFPALALVSLLIAGCTPYIPIKDAFGVSALKPTGTIPPEFAEFNSYDPRVNPLVADQICATPYQPQVVRSVTAAPGEIVAASGRCQTYYPRLFAKLGRTFQPATGTAP